MKKLIILAIATISLMAQAQKPLNDLIKVGSRDTVTTTNTTAVYFYPDSCVFSADASFCIDIDTIHTTGASTLAGYAVLEYSLDGGQNYASGIESSDSVALIKGTDTAVYIAKKVYGSKIRIKIACSGTHKTRFGLSWKYSMPLIGEYNKSNNGMPGFKNTWKNDHLLLKSNFYVDSVTLTNTQTKFIKITNVGLYDGKMIVQVYSDTVASQTVAGYAYLQGSNNNRRWANIERIALVRKDGVICFSAVQTYFRYYRVRVTTSGTHKSRFGVGYYVKSL